MIVKREFLAWIMILLPIVALSGEREQMLLENGVPEVIINLNSWPDEGEVKDRLVSKTSEMVVSADLQFRYWIKEVLDPEWFPSEDSQVLYISGGEKGRDVIRAKWKVHEYQVEMAQTKSIFFIKISNLPENYLSVRRLLHDVLYKELPIKGKETQLGSVYPENLAAVATWLTFEKMTTMRLEGMEEFYFSQLVSPQHESPVYTMDWFETIGLWVVDENLVFFFEKTQGGGSHFTKRSAFKPEFDINWFESEQDEGAETRVSVSDLL